jgi:hypothetical protein
MAFMKQVNGTSEIYSSCTHGQALAVNHLALGIS